MNSLKQVNEVFGVSPEVKLDSYVDRGDLDAHLQRLLQRSTHIALRGESKCGKSWLRQHNISNAIVVQCRLKRSVLDLYKDALSQLDIKLTIEQSSSGRWKGYAEANGALGTKLLAALGFKASVEAEKGGATKRVPVGQDTDDLRFVADIIKKSQRRLVIEDFHYLSIEERRAFAFDLKTLWDYGLYIVIVGVWSRSNMLLALNP